MPSTPAPVSQQRQTVGFAPGRRLTVGCYPDGASREFPFVRPSISRIVQGFSFY